MFSGIGECLGTSSDAVGRRSRDTLEKSMLVLIVKFGLGFEPEPFEEESENSGPSESLLSFFRKAVVNRFIQLYNMVVQEAQEKADRVVALEVDDLEASETPESILLGAVSGDQTKDRTDRALVTPWLKFLWESYRTALETLKNNARLETIYQVRTHSIGTLVHEITRASV